MPKTETERCKNVVFYTHIFFNCRRGSKSKRQEKAEITRRSQWFNNHFVVYR